MEGREAGRTGGQAAMKVPVSHDKEFNLYPKGNMEVLSLLNQGVIVPELYLKNG